MYMTACVCVPVGVCVCVSVCGSLCACECVSEQGLSVSGLWGKRAERLEVRGHVFLPY